MIDGLEVTELRTNVDERGFLVEILRNDWEVYEQPAMSYFSKSYPNVVRAWHRHLRGQIDFFCVVSGAVKVCVYDDRKGSKTKGELDEIIVSEDRLRVVKVPGNCWHGFKAIGNKPAILVNFPTKLYDYKDPDEERRPWNDPKIVPTSINGKTTDPRVGAPWDWNRSPNK